MGHGGGNRWLATTGQKVHALILTVAAFYLVAHGVWGVWLCAELVRTHALVMVIMVVVTSVVALGNLVVAAPLWVYTAVGLLRGPRPMASLPTLVPDDALPQIVVQIPGRNEATAHVQLSIDSVLAADYPPDKLQIQFIDNSDDERWREVEALYAEESRVRIEHREGTKGFKAGNLNIGLDRLGTFSDQNQVLIGLLDVGDTFAPQVLRPMATEFIQEPKLGFVQGMFRIGNPSETIISWSDGYVGDAARRFTEGYIAHYGIPTMNGHCVVLRLSALEDVGRWNDSRVAEDWNTGIMMMTRGWLGKWVDYEPTNPDMVSTELVPGEIAGQQKQKRRWATGGTELAKLHLMEWMRSSLPWNQRLSLFLRLGANFSVLPGFVAQLLFPIWIAFALFDDSSKAALSFGIISALVQNPFMWANLVAALNYAREGHRSTALAVVFAYPIQAFWRLPLFSHAGLGIAEGLAGGLKTFVITPKTSEEMSVLRILKSQRLVVGVSVCTILPVLVAWALQPQQASILLLAALALPILTVGALFLVPLTQWFQQRILTSRDSSAGASSKRG